MEIGDLLRREREKKGLSLSDVENDTKIRVRYIQALETEQFEIIPGEVYRLGFLKNYARLLDLDPETIIASYKSAREGADRGASPGEEQAGTRQFVGARRSIRDADQPTAQQKKAVAHRPDARRPVIDWAGKIAQAGSIFKNRRVLLGVASAVILVLLIVAGVGLSRHTRLPAAQPQVQTPPAVPPTVYAQPQTLEIELVGTGHCWAEVKVDDTEAYMGIINPGDTKTFTAQSTVWVDLGYPKSVDVYYNGTKLPPLGTTSPVTRTFTKNMGAWLN